MKGKYEVVVKSRRVQYKFSVIRNITILRGDSATGKTTLIDMIAAYQENGEASGVTVISKKQCTVLTGIRWQENLSLIHDSIVFIDEGDKFVASEDFAKAIKNTDNYYVIATRTPLFNLPYSVKEIYGIKNVSGNRFQGTKRLYAEFYPLCRVDTDISLKPDLVITEDSKSGYRFFENYFFGVRDKLRFSRKQGKNIQRAYNKAVRNGTGNCRRSRIRSGDTACPIAQESEKYRTFSARIFRVGHSAFRCRKR